MHRKGNHNDINNDDINNVGDYFEYWKSVTRVHRKEGVFYGLPITVIRSFLLWVNRKNTGAD